MTNFSKNLKFYREKLGLSQEKMAKLLGISSKTLYRYEKGEATPKVGTVRKIADILGVDFYELTGMKPILKKAIHQTNINHGHQGTGNIGSNLDKVNNTFSNTDDPELEIICKYVKELNEENRKKVLKFVLDLEN